MTKAHLRKYARSGTDRCEICKRTKVLVTHHLAGRDIPDWNKAANVCRICSDDHQDIHMVPPRIVIEGWAMSTEGRILVWRRPGQPQVTDHVAPVKGYCPGP